MTTQAPNVTKSNTTKSIFDLAEGICKEIPSAIHLTIAYTRAGSVNNLTIYNIIGGKISYSFSEWNFEQYDEESFKKFSISSTVSFDEVTPQYQRIQK